MHVHDYTNGIKKERYYIITSFLTKLYYYGGITDRENTVDLRKHDLYSFINKYIRVTTKLFLKKKTLSKLTKYFLSIN